MNRNKNLWISRSKMDICPLTIQRWLGKRVDRKYWRSRNLSCISTQWATTRQRRSNPYTFIFNIPPCPLLYSISYYQSIWEKTWSKPAAYITDLLILESTFNESSKTTVGTRDSFELMFERVHLQRVLFRKPRNRATYIFSAWNSSWKMIHEQRVQWQPDVYTVYNMYRAWTSGLSNYCIGLTTDASSRIDSANSFFNQFSPTGC